MPQTETNQLQYFDPATLQKLGGLEVIAQTIVEGVRVGVHKSPLRGFSTEFAHHRQYVPGDPVRHLDWRVYGRTERYYIKLYEAETNYDANFLIDTSSSMRYGSGDISKVEYTKYLAASMAYLIVQQRDSVGMGFFDAELRKYIPPRSTMGVIGIMDEEMKRAKDEPLSNIGKQLHDFADRIPRRGLVMLFSDCFDDVEHLISGLDHLHFEGHNVTVFHVMDPYELKFPFKGTWQFKGLENEEPLTTQPQRIRDAYLEELRKFQAAISAGCERCQVDYVLVDISRPVDVVIIEYLRRRMRAKGMGTSG